MRALCVYNQVSRRVPLSTQPKTFLTPEQYLEIERDAPRKSEYYRGEMFAMAGASRAHNLLISNLLFLLVQQLLDRPCSVYPSDMRLLAGPGGLYTYPDVSVVCGESRFTDDTFDTLMNPDLIVEVLSPSTESYDRGRKAEQYRSIESLKRYLLVSSDCVHVELFARQPDGHWLLTEFNRLEEAVELHFLGCRLPLSSLYKKVDLPLSTL